MGSASNIHEAISEYIESKARGPPDDSPFGEHRHKFYVQLSGTLSVSGYVTEDELRHYVGLSVSVPIDVVSTIRGILRCDERTHPYVDILGDNVGREPGEISRQYKRLPIRELSGRFRFHLDDMRRTETFSRDGWQPLTLMIAEALPVID